MGDVKVGELVFVGCQSAVLLITESTERNEDVEAATMECTPCCRVFICWDLPQRGDTSTRELLLCSAPRRTSEATARLDGSLVGDLHLVYTRYPR